jgi:hypothetical protein
LSRREVSPSAADIVRFFALVNLERRNGAHKESGP